MLVRDNYAADDFNFGEPIVDVVDSKSDEAFSSKKKILRDTHLIRLKHVITVRHRRIENNGKWC